jgi:protein-disulfide isomerase
MKRHHIRGLIQPLVLAALLLVVALVLVACAQLAPAAPAATTAPVQVSPATSAPTQTAAPVGPIASSNLPAGVNAEGNFYRGDPNATVKLVEFSDFQ